MLRRFLLLALAALLGWRIVSIGVSAYYAERVQGGDDNAPRKALAWNANQPDALIRQAITLRQQDPDAAAALLARAYAENPADSRSLMAMAEIARTQGDEPRSESLVSAAVNLAPADPRIQKQAAAYWIRRERLAEALRHWSLALEIDQASRRQLFPLLRKLAEDPSTRPALEPFASSPPSWWESFFEDIAKNATDLEAVRILYALRSESRQAPVTHAERQAYVSRLMREGVAAEAYVHWANGLSREQREKLASVHDGGFELEPTDWGFGWKFVSRHNALVDRAHTYGVDGETALHLLFKNHDGQFRGVSQALFLDPGRYRLTGKVRTDSLVSKGGIKWLARCVLPEATNLGESERFLGANKWRPFSFEFEVPDTCLLQDLRLVSAGKRAFELELTGGAWFDRLSIRKLPESMRPKNTRLQKPDSAAATASDPSAPSTEDSEVSAETSPETTQRP